MKTEKANKKPNNDKRRKVKRKEEKRRRRKNKNKTTPPLYCPTSHQEFIEMFSSTVSVSATASLE